MIKKETVFTCEYHDIEKLIQDTYGIEEYNLPCIECCSNDTSLTYTIDKTPLREYQEKRIKEFIEEPNKEYMTQTFMGDLCNKDIIEPGKYVVNVSW